MEHCFISRKDGGTKVEIDRKDEKYIEQFYSDMILLTRHVSQIF